MYCKIRVQFCSAHLSAGCQYCKKAKPEYVKAADFLRQLATNTQDSAASSAASRVLFAHVDCTDVTLQSVCLSEEVESYPTIRYYNYGKFQSLHDPSVYPRDVRLLVLTVEETLTEAPENSTCSTLCSSPGLCAS